MGVYRFQCNGELSIMYMRHSLSSPPLPLPMMFQSQPVPFGIPDCTVPFILTGTAVRPDDVVQRIPGN